MLKEILALVQEGQDSDQANEIFKKIEDLIDRHDLQRAPVSVQLNCFFDNSNIRQALLEHDKGMLYDRWRDDINCEAELQENFLEYLQETSVQDFDLDPEEYLSWIIQCKVDLPF